MTKNKVTITAQNNVILLDCAADHLSLLETLEAHEIDVEYQCREGYCGVCRARLLKGQVHYFQKPLAFLNKNEILLCSCQAVEEVEIELFL